MMPNGISFPIGIYQYRAQMLITGFRFLSERRVSALAQFNVNEYPDEEAHGFSIHVSRYAAWAGPWMVTVECTMPRRSVWEHGGVKVTADHCGDAVSICAEEGSEAQKARAVYAVRQRLPAWQKDIPPELWRWALHCKVVAVSPTEVLVSLFASGDLVRAAQNIHVFICNLWPQVEQAADSGEFIALLRNINLSYEEIAEELGVSVDTIKRRAKELQTKGLVPRRRVGRKRKGE